MDKKCRNGLFLLPGLLAIAAGLTVLGIAICLTPSAIPGIKKGLKSANDWRNKQGLKTHKEYKEVIKSTTKEK